MLLNLTEYMCLCMTQKLAVVLSSANCEELSSQLECQNYGLIWRLHWDPDSPSLRHRYRTRLKRIRRIK